MELRRVLWSLRFTFLSTLGEIPYAHLPMATRRGKGIIDSGPATLLPYLSLSGPPGAYRVIISKSSGEFCG